MASSRIVPVLIVLVLGVASAAPVGPELARVAASARMSMDGRNCSMGIDTCTGIFQDDETLLLAYAFDLKPVGYIITSADDRLPPVIAYSYTDDLMAERGEDPLLHLIRMDMEGRMASLEGSEPVLLDPDRSAWERIASGYGTDPDRDFQQWPPEGSTPTGGWMQENWTQTAPYNRLCPMDLLAGERSAAGCPAVAMAMILNFYGGTNGTRFDDGDDYFHNYQEYYWIDDDHLAHDFPSWPELNDLLCVLDSLYQNQLPLGDMDKATLVYASGAACRQVYTASVSGTFGVEQAYDAYLRFGFQECELLYDFSDSLHQRMADEIIGASPVHLAVLDEGPQYGHNLVVDGYNTDEFYHLNFGWGGSSNGWYRFPLSGMPYGMNFIEGVILDIGSGPLSTGENPAAPGPGQVSLTCPVNPCTCSSVLTLEVMEGCRVITSVYTVSGRLLEELDDRVYAPGSHEITWFPYDSPAGVYFVRALHPWGAEAIRLTLLDP